MKTPSNGMIAFIVIVSILAVAKIKSCSEQPLEARTDYHSDTSVSPGYSKQITSSNYSQSPEETHQTKFTKLDAYTKAQDFVKTKLASPSTAEFIDGYERCTVQKNDTTFVIDSYVDSQNYYGGMVRSRFICEITYHPKTDSIFCTSLNVF